MHFSKIVLLPLFASSALAVTYADVLNDLKQTDTDTNTLTTQFNGYTGTGAQTLAIRTQVKKVITDIQKATDDTKAAPVPSVADGTTVYNYVNGQLYNDSRTSQVALRNKKSVLVSNGFGAEACGYTKQIRSAVATLADALIAKAPNQDLKTKGATTKANYDKLFADTLTAFGC